MGVSRSGIPTHLEPWHSVWRSSGNHFGHHGGDRRHRLALFGVPADGIDDLERRIVLRTGIGFAARTPREWAKSVCVPTFLYGELSETALGVIRLSRRRALLGSRRPPRPFGSGR
jgi:hypothetical protein